MACPNSIGEVPNDQHAVVSAQGLCKSYDATVALRDVSFEVRPGQVLGVLGPNGAGKSTIVKIITGLLDPSQGRVLFRGNDLRDQGEEFRQTLGYVPEHADLYGFLTGWEYVDMACSLRGMPPRMFRRRALALFEAMRLSEARGQRISSYSKGMRQRIVLITALIHDPAFLVLDEPFSGLDVTSGLVIRRVISLLAERGKAIFFCSPSLEHLEQVSTSLLVLRSGGIVATGTPEEVKNRFGGGSLTAGFLHLAEAPDTDQIARSILEATNA